MTPHELNNQQAEILSAHARDLAQQLQATPLSAEQQKKSGEVVGDVAELAIDVVDTDLMALALKGVGKAVSGLGDIATGALDLAGSAVSAAGDVAGGAASAAGEVVGGVLEGVGEIIGGLLG